MAFPFLMAMLLWWCPRVIKDFKDILKPRKYWFTMFEDYIKQQNASLNYYKNAAKNLQELNKELKEDNDKYDEQQMEQMYKYYKNGGIVNEH